MSGRNFISFHTLVLGRALGVLVAGLVSAA